MYYNLFLELNGSASMHQDNILDFWFTELEPKQWFIKDVALDKMIREKFSGLHQRAQQGELWQWRTSAAGALAEIIILDQFSRNIYRDKPQSFAADSMALTLAQTAVANEFDHGLSTVQRAFLYMPYMHSESAVIHQQAVTLFDQPGMEHNYDYELKHKVIIDRFGRYPHRNHILGRESTKEESAFLQEEGSSF